MSVALGLFAAIAQDGGMRESTPQRWNHNLDETERTETESPAAPARRAAVHFVVVCAAMVVAMSIYFLIANDGRTDVMSTKTAVDAWVPLVPWFVWIYLSPYVVAPILVVNAGGTVFRRLARRGVIVIALQLAIFFFLPTVVDRPTLLIDATSSLSERTLAWVYGVDTPSRNAAPSGQVSMYFVLAWAASQSLGRLGPLAWVHFSLVAISIVLTKQHHVIDLVTGFALGALVLGGVSMWERGSTPPRSTPKSKAVNNVLPR